MLFTLPPIDVASASILLAEIQVGRPAISWTLPKDDLISDRSTDPKYQVTQTQRRALSEVEDRIVWKSLFDSGEVLYTL
jgi:hypothetical protein